jgi:hypothetical protein
VIKSGFQPLNDLAKVAVTPPGLGPIPPPPPEPAWQGFDPLPVLAAKKRDKKKDQDRDDNGDDTNDDD